MFHLLATTKCKRQQIAILIISFFAYVAGIRNEGNNMLLQKQQQHELLQQQKISIEYSDNKSRIAGIRQQSTLNFRPSQVIDFTPADATITQQFRPTFLETPHSNVNNNENNNNNVVSNNVPQKQETENSNRRYTIETAATHGNAAEKPFSFPNEQQQIPQHLTDKPIYIYRDPFTNENYHYTPTETNVKETTQPATYNHNIYNNEAYKQQNTHYQPQPDDNQQYLVQSSMTVGTHQQQQQLPQHQQQEINPLRPYMSLSADKDVYLKRPGLVYDEKPGYNHPNSVIDKKTEINKISYDSHDYPPPSYFQQQTSNFLPTPVPAKPPTAAPIVKPSAASNQIFKPPSASYPSLYVQQRPQQQYTQSSQSALPNYANSIDNYLLNKQQTSEYYRTEAPTPPPTHYLDYSQPPVHYEKRPPSFANDKPPSYEHQQYPGRPPPFSSANVPHPQYESASPFPGRPSYNNYYGYQIGEIPPPTTQQFNYPYQRPPSQYTYQGPYRPPTPPATQQNGFATLAQYAPQFTSLLLGGVGGGTGGTNNNGPLGSLIGALTGATNTQQSTSSFNRRPVNSQLIRALENIARNDDLQCVPKVLCQMIAGQTQRGQLPAFVTSPAITNFLAGFPAASPALIYGRAALLGLSGGVRSCHQTYVKCPKDEYEIIDYLNNHRGGFFKFFSEPEEHHQQTVNHDTTQQGATSLFSILSALTGTPQTTTTTPRPTPRPKPPPADITSGIGNFFTQLLSDYVGGAAVEYQKRFKRRAKRSLDDKIKFESENEENHSNTIKFQDESRETHRDVFKFKDHDFDENEDDQQDIEEDFHDEEDEEDTQQGIGFIDDQQDYLDTTQGRVLHNTGGKGKRIKFFPEMRNENSYELQGEEQLKEIIKKFNDFNRERKLRFPTATDERIYTETDQENIRQGKTLNEDSIRKRKIYGPQFTNYVENTFENMEREKQKIKFIDNAEEESEEQELDSYSSYLKDYKKPAKNIVFPQREGKILNHNYYAASYQQGYLQGPPEQEEKPGQNEEFVLANDQRPLDYTEFPTPPSFNIYNSQLNSLNSQNSFSSNVNNNIFVSSPANNKNKNHFLPTPPPPQETDFTSSNLIYSNKDFTSSHQNKQNFFKKPPSAGSSSTPAFSNNNNFYKPSSSIYNRYHSSFYTTRRPSATEATTQQPDNKNIYVTNSRGVTEYYITPDGRKVYL